MNDTLRIERIRRAMAEHALGGLACCLPSNVLLLSGYFPVTGTSIAVATQDRTILLVPSDERELAERGWADEVRSFEAASLDWIKTTFDAIQPSLAGLLAEAGLSHQTIGYESEDWVQPASYAAINELAVVIGQLLSRSAPTARLRPAKLCLQQLRLIKTPSELAKIRTACDLAGHAFEQGARQLASGRSEAQVAAAFRAPLMVPSEHGRSDGCTFCMSGLNAAKAYKAFQLNGTRILAESDLVLVHCNSYTGGYWTDITRTFCLGRPNDLQRRMYDAVFAARQAAMDAIRPGTAAKDVDLAARKVMEAHGFGKQFLHPTGHGVGFAAIDHSAQPRLHPRSPDILQTGMVFNVEPGIYFKGECGMRHCDMVAVTVTGAELLTPFHTRGSLTIT